MPSKILAEIAELQPQQVGNQNLSGPWISPYATIKDGQSSLPGRNC